MRFALPEDAIAIAEGLRAMLRADCPPELVRAAWLASGDADVRALWRTLGDLGVLGLLVPESDGGLGCDELIFVAAFEEIGYAAAPGPILHTTAIGAPLIVSAGDPFGSLAAVLNGSELVATGLGGSGLIPNAQISDLFILGAIGQPAIARRASLAIDGVETIDGSRRAGRIDGVGVPLRLNRAVVERAVERATLGAAAELVGLSSRMLEITGEYVRNRTQFGVAIGSFQAVKHHLADARVAVEFARPAIWRAAASLASGDGEASCHVSMAKSLASSAARRVARTAIQCHGAMGYTVEYDLHLFAKRAWAVAAEWGSADTHLDNVAVALGLM